MTNLKDTTTIVQNKAYSGSFQFVVNVSQCQCQSMSMSIINLYSASPQKH